MCEKNKPDDLQHRDTRCPEAIERQNQLTRFLQEINSGKKPSDESVNWWMHQY